MRLSTLTAGHLTTSAGSAEIISARPSIHTVAVTCVLACRLSLIVRAHTSPPTLARPITRAARSSQNSMMPNLGGGSYVLNYFRIILSFSRRRRRLVRQGLAIIDLASFPELQFALFVRQPYVWFLLFLAAYPPKAHCALSSESFAAIPQGPYAPEHADACRDLNG